MDFTTYLQDKTSSSMSQTAHIVALGLSKGYQQQEFEKWEKTVCSVFIGNTQSLVVMSTSFSYKVCS